MLIVMLWSAWLEAPNVPVGGNGYRGALKLAACRGDTRVFGLFLVGLYQVGADAPNVPVEGKVIAAPYCLLTAAALFSCLVIGSMLR